jgi:hypothetical protein
MVPPHTAFGSYIKLNPSNDGLLESYQPSDVTAPRAGRNRREREDFGEMCHACHEGFWRPGRQDARAKRAGEVSARI